MKPITTLLALLAFHSLLAADAFLTSPDIRDDSVVFTAEGDLWVGSLTSGTASRLTTHQGQETAAHFSPDGSLIAFTGNYDGNTDVYVMPVVGGQPKRLTYSGEGTGSVVMGWTPDGKNVIFRSRRQSPENLRRFWLVPVNGGLPKLLPVPRGEFVSMNDDGRTLAYVPVSAAWQNWFRYQGGQADDIWLADINAKTFKKLTDYPGVDTTPVWVGNTIYFVSERDGLGNLYKLNPQTKAVSRVTSFDDYALMRPATDGKKIVFEYGNGLGIYDVASGQSRALNFSLNSDRIHTRQRRVAAAQWVNYGSIGPTGKRLLIEARGQILSVPTESGDYRIVAEKQGSRSQFPAWSPDGKQIAFISDRSGEEQIWVISAISADTPRQITRQHKGPLGKIVWSPDGKTLAVGDREMRIYLVDVATGKMTLVDQGDRSGSYDTTNYSYRFSTDSKWLTYSMISPNWNQTVYIYEIATGKKVQLTTNEMDSFAPVFDATGKYLLFISNRNLNPMGSGPSQFFAFDKTAKVSLITLARDTPSPFAPEINEEGATEEKKDEAKKEVRVDLEGIASRVVDVPMAAGRYVHLEALEGKILALSTEDVSGEGNPAAPNTLVSFDMKKKEATTLVNRLTEFELSADSKKLLLRTEKEFAVVDSGTGPVAPGTGQVKLDGAALIIDPTQEWKQIFYESWRIARDFFYDPNMHGVNWDAVKAKYEKQLPAVGDRNDLNVVLSNMIAELNVGHAYVGGGDISGESPQIPIGYLGADLVWDSGGYKIQKMYAGDEFDFSARSPLLEPGLNVKPGDYILAIGGQPVRADQDISALLVGTPGRIITITVNSTPNMVGSRTIRLKPMGSDRLARYYDWVAGRRQYVRKNAGDNFAYVHIPDMSEQGLKEFTKHYYPNVEKDAIVYDVRYNGGGYISSMLLLQAAAKPYTWFKPRYGASWTRQSYAFLGYAAALSNEYSGSNAEEFCDAFQRLKLGPVIGVRTWGGEVGSGGGYPLVDGGQLFIPNYGEWAPNGSWVVEGTGAVPDIVVEQDPAAVLAGKDPQLDAAIAYLKQQLQKKPVVHPLPPKFPIKTAKKGGR